MTDVLYYSRNPNPRLGLAVALHLKAPLRLEWAASFDPAQEEKFRALNPTRLLPILVEGDRVLWEVDAIACRLSQRMGSDFWRMGREMPEMNRWISWAKARFTAAIDTVHFERGTKQRYGIGPVDPARVAEGTGLFHASARQLDDHLAGRDYLLDDGLSYADFRMAAYLPFNDAAGLPLQEYPAICAWYDRLLALAHWADPFAGLEAPELPPLPGRLG
jgi:glutathione S-transferase